MTLQRSEMKRGTKPLRNSKPMSRGTSTLSRGTGFRPAASTLASTGPIKAKPAKDRPPRVAKVPALVADEVPFVKEPKAAPARKRGLKTSRPKMTPIRESAKNEECLLRFPCCNHRIDTTVLCHRNGAGAGMKASDFDAAYGCYACHLVLDGHAPRPEGFTRDMMLESFETAVQETHGRLVAKRLMLAEAAAEYAAQKNKSRTLLQAGIRPLK